MFTIKLYSDRKCVIKEADSFTVLHGDDGEAEISLHYKNMTDNHRIDISHEKTRAEGWPEVFDKAIIENSSGRTIEIIGLLPSGAHLISANSRPPAHTPPPVSN